MQRRRWVYGAHAADCTLCTTEPQVTAKSETQKVKLLKKNLSIFISKKLKEKNIASCRESAIFPRTAK